MDVREMQFANGTPGAEVGMEYKQERIPTLRVAERLNTLLAEGWEFVEILQHIDPPVYRNGMTSYDFDTEEEYRDRMAQIRERDEELQVRMEIIEEMLARYDARMMRPYEHWNEDEQYMQYMEA